MDGGTGVRDVRALESAWIVNGGIFNAVFLLWIAGLRGIPNSRVGIVEKLWSPRGPLDSRIIALNGEAGFQPGVVRGGVHFFFQLQYRVHTCLQYCTRLDGESNSFLTNSRADRDLIFSQHRILK